MQIVIDPIIGLIGLPFGSKLPNLIDFLGEPDFQEAVESVVQHELIEHLEFDKSDIICYIKGKEKADLILNDVEIYNSNCELFGVNIFELNSKDAIALLAEHDYPLLEKEIDGEIVIISFNHCFMDFIYKKDQLKCIEISDFNQNFE
jgi:hypothetical protein